MQRQKQVKTERGRERDRQTGEEREKGTVISIYIRNDTVSDRLTQTHIDLHTHTHIHMWRPPF